MKSKKMHDLVKELFPITRSITGNGVRETLAILKKRIPIKVHEVPSGTKVFDWTIPKEWNIKAAYILDPFEKKIVDYKKNNLHVLNYSIPVRKTVTLEELEEHLFSLPDQPNAIPYVTSYYKERWGFCLTHNDRKKLPKGRYQVLIDSTLKKGHLTYGEYVIPGKSKKEILISTYICHPSLANDELSGPVVATFLADWVRSERRYYTYRFIFIPETIGSIAYLSKNLRHLKKNVIAVFNLSCVGDERAFSYVASRYENTYADRIMDTVLSFMHPSFIKHSFLDRGSDERQYGAPGVDLPVVTFCRSKFGTFPEYHTSLDNLKFVTEKGLRQSLEVLKNCVLLAEKNSFYEIKCSGEPQLGKRGLYPTISTKTSTYAVKDMMNFIAYADGQNDLISISKRIKAAPWRLYEIIEKLSRAKLLNSRKFLP